MKGMNGQIDIKEHMNGMTSQIDKKRTYERSD